MFEFKMRVYDVLAADSDLTDKLSTVPGTNRPAIYLNHLSEFSRVTYPAVSLFWDGVGADQRVQCAEGGVLLVEVWTEERASDASALLAGDLSGAWSIYRIPGARTGCIKPLLHRAHLRGTLASPAYQLSCCAELDASITEEFDQGQKLYHLQARYRVELVPADAALMYPNG